MRRGAEYDDAPRRQESMRLLPILWPLPLVLVIHACGGGGGPGSPPDTDAGGLPPGLFSLAGAGGTAPSVPTTVDDAGPQVQFGDDAEVVGTLDAGAIIVADAEVFPDAALAGDAGTDAAVDAGHDAGPPPLADTCEPCVDHADCLPLLLCATSTSAGGRFCFPRTTGGASCNTAPGGEYLQEGAHVANPDSPSFTVLLCTPHSNMIVGAGYPTITCAQWHTLTGL